MADALTRRAALQSIAATLTCSVLPAGCTAAAPEAPAIPPTPRLNQVGFPLASVKHFVLPASPSAKAGDRFIIERLNGAPVFEGQLQPELHNLTATSGEQVRTGDFSAFRTPGRYRVRVAGARSHPFAIGDAVYSALVRDAARAFHLIRANTAVDDRVTGLKFAAGHLGDGALLVDSQPRDLTGGWYNAGDFGKWTHMAAITASEMMWLHELRPAARTMNLDVDNAYPGLPDLLEQARWGLEWLLKMQNRDGSVLHKIDSNEHYAFGSPPQQDANPRFVYPASSLDAGNFTGVMLQANRVFRPFDEPFAASCRAAALRAWSWLERNPSVLQNDINYMDLDPRQEAAWATFAMAAEGADRNLADRAAASLKLVGVVPQTWQAPQLLGLMSLARSQSPASGIARAAIRMAADGVANRVAHDPYGYSAEPDDYHWGSNESALNDAVLCLFAADLEGTPRHEDTAQRLVGYVLGCNALDLSFVTGHGEHRVSRPYHWTCKTFGIVMPGWASGGANHFAESADPMLKALIEQGTVPARCFVDAYEPNGSWASNEGQISENAALVLAAGLLGLAA